MSEHEKKETCPSCGYCPHCGRGGQYVAPGRYPLYPTWPYRWYFTNTGATSSDTATTDNWTALSSVTGHRQ